jgi:hypothetical protein
MPGVGSVASVNRRVVVALLALVAPLVLAAAVPAATSPYYHGVVVTVEYGPACHKDKYGGQECGSNPTPGVGVRLTTDGSRATIAKKASTSSPNGLSFQGSIPGVFDVFFSGSVKGRRYSGGWRTPNLSAVEQQPLRLYVLLCPDGGWVASVENVAESCSDRSASVLASGR